MYVCHQAFNERFENVDILKFISGMFVHGSLTPAVMDTRGFTSNHFFLGCLLEVRIWGVCV